MIIIRKHDKREAPSMTPSKDTIDYFKDINIVCVATEPIDSKKQYPEAKYCHDQRFCVMDEPTISDLDKVYFTTFLCLNIIIIILYQYFLYFYEAALFE